MVKNDNLPPQSILRDLLSYDLETGVFIWRAAPSFAASWGGTIAGTVKPGGYRMIGVAGFPQLGAHRLAWIYVHGSIPAGYEVDHRDNNPSNNRISNLRLATSSQQKMNRRVQSNNRAGIKGAFWHKPRGRWKSQIRIGKKPDGKPIVKFLGYFDTPEEAAAAYRAAEIHHFGEFASQAAP